MSANIQYNNMYCMHALMFVHLIYSMYVHGECSVCGSILYCTNSTQWVLEYMMGAILYMMGTRVHDGY